MNKTRNVDYSLRGFFGMLSAIRSKYKVQSSDDLLEVSIRILLK